MSATRRALRAPWFALLAICAASCSLHGTSSGNGANGITETYAFGAYDRNFSGSVVVDLPARPANTSWFANWIMVVARRPNFLEQPFVQVGEIRYLNPTEYPSAFLAYQRPGGVLVYKDLGRVAEGEHLASIDGNARSLTLRFDHRVVGVFPRSRYFDARDRPYFQFASEVKAQGDVPTGYLRNILVKDDRQSAPQPLTPRCVRYDRGLDMSIEGNRYIPSGTFTPDAPSGFRDCALAR